MKKACTRFHVYLSCLFILGIAFTLEARIWTDAATNRTLSGDFVEVDGTKVVIKLDTGKDISVAIDHLIDANQEFIQLQKTNSCSKRG